MRVAVVPDTGAIGGPGKDIMGGPIGIAAAAGVVKVWTGGGAEGGACKSITSAGLMPTIGVRGNMGVAAGMKGAEGGARMTVGVGLLSTNGALPAAAFKYGTGAGAVVS